MIVVVLCKRAKGENIEVVSQGKVINWLDFTRLKCILKIFCTTKLKDSILSSVSNISSTGHMLYNYRC